MATRLANAFNTDEYKVHYARTNGDNKRVLVCNLVLDIMNGADDSSQYIEAVKSANQTF